ncbi:unnamed protein product [Ixodes pacificus]
MCPFPQHGSEEVGPFLPAATAVPRLSPMKPTTRPPHAGTLRPH